MEDPPGPGEPGVDEEQLVHGSPPLGAFEPPPVGLDVGVVAVLVGGVAVVVVETGAGDVLAGEVVTGAGETGDREVLAGGVLTGAVGRGAGVLVGRVVAVGAVVVVVVGAPLVGALGVVFGWEAGFLQVLRTPWEAARALGALRPLAVFCDLDAVRACALCALDRFRRVPLLAVARVLRTDRADACCGPGEQFEAFVAALWARVAWLRVVLAWRPRPARASARGTTMATTVQHRRPAVASRRSQRDAMVIIDASFGSRAVCERSLALRPRLATGVPFVGGRGDLRRRRQLGAFVRRLCDPARNWTYVQYRDPSARDGVSGPRGVADETPTPRCTTTRVVRCGYEKRRVASAAGAKSPRYRRRCISTA